jgi:type VI secretion system protein ImpK
VRHGASVVGQFIEGSSLNPLVEAAAEALRAGGLIRNTLANNDVNALRQQLLDMIKAYEAAGNRSGYEPQIVLTGRYLLCTFLDEAVMSTPWGAQSQWTQQTLLSTCHNETWGGEKFFQIIEHHLHRSESVDLIELAATCLLLGFVGQYAVRQNGPQELDQVIDELYAVISRARGEFERDLSPSWRGAQETQKRLIDYTPNWVILAITGALLLVLYTGFRLTLGYQVIPVKEQIQGLVKSVEKTTAD